MCIGMCGLTLFQHYQSSISTYCAWLSLNMHLFHTGTSSAHPSSFYSLMYPDVQTHMYTVYTSTASVCIHQNTYHITSLRKSTAQGIHTPQTESSEREILPSIVSHGVQMGIGGAEKIPLHLLCDSSIPQVCQQQISQQFRRVRCRLNFNTQHRFGENDLGEIRSIKMSHVTNHSEQKVCHSISLTCTPADPAHVCVNWRLLSFSP